MCSNTWAGDYASVFQKVSTIREFVQVQVTVLAPEKLGVFLLVASEEIHDLYRYVAEFRVVVHTNRAVRLVSK